MKESEIRPKDIFDEYLRLAKADTEAFFKNSRKVTINCPACNSIGEHSFQKDSFDYCECNKCGTLYVNPRPASEAFTDYYTNSPSSKYWATTFYKKTENARREKIWKPKVDLITDVLIRENAEIFQIIDIGGGYGIFAEEMRKNNNKSVLIIEPSLHLAKICRKKGFNVIEKFLADVKIDDLSNQPKCFVSFELFEHLHNPEEFLINLNGLMQQNDIFIFTTLSGFGLDIQVLWDNSPTVSPPHHLNFLNPYSIKIILERTGFKCLDINTPGKLDIDILNNNKKFVNDRFWKIFLSSSNKDQKQKYQKLITESGFSSHMMVVCKKP